MNRSDRWARLSSLMALLALGSCGGGGGGGETAEPPPPAAASCTNRMAEFQGVCTGFPDNASLDWNAGGGGDGGVGDGGASGDGGVGAGGDFGQFRNATIRVFKDDGSLLGEALTDNVKGMVTIRPGAAYRGSLRIELRGSATAEYFEEGKNRFVPFPADRVIRVIVPRIDKNIGITAFTEAAYQLLTQGSAPESVPGVANPTPAQIRAANLRVVTLLNKQFPKALEVDDITRLPFIKSAAVAQGSLTPDKRGVYGVVSGAFSKQAALFNTGTDSPTLDAVDQLAEDLRDGVLDGRDRGTIAGRVNRRTYDPNTLTSELTAALSQQAERFGSQALKDLLPQLVNYGGTRYEGYLFDSSITRNRGAVSTVAGWLAANSLNFQVGQGLPKALPAGQSAHSMISNFGHGGAFFKIDTTDTTATPVYRVYALGDNVNGELGTGDRISTSRALVEVVLPGPLTHAAGGFAHSVLRLADGRVFVLGDNSFGQLGQGVDGNTLARTTTALEVPLPAAAGGAVAVAATSVASYALMADGSIYAWGSNGGFGLLGNGQATGMQTSPVAVAGISDGVQISARDNDVVVLKRDQSIWQWGSHPADVNAFTDGDVTSAYRGGTFVPTAVQGLPTTTTNGVTTPVPVRKILTEQGMFAALLDNAQVWTWGVHFDLSAKTVLRDLTAARVLGLPPVRDMMPGGFVGYGARPFDRLTAMSVDYGGGMWKVRGRVAESFDPANPTQQRRPQTGLARSANCASCHTFLDDTLPALRARQAAESPVPASAATCLPPSTVHIATNGLSLIKAETECIQCHNPARLNPAYAGQLTPAFVANGGWPNCNKPTNLPPRDTVLATPITTSCIVPAFHVFTPPGTVCSSCHNSVAARALQDMNPPCAQPLAQELPQIAVTGTITSVTEDNGTVIANGAYTRDPTPQIDGTLSIALTGDQGLAVERNGRAAGFASTSGVTFRFVDNAAPQGTQTYAVRVVNQRSQFGPLSNQWTVRVDSIPPTATPQITTLLDDVFGNIADGGFSTDSTPTLNGTLSAVPGNGEALEVLRNGAAAGLATVTGTNWTFAETAALPVGSYAYTLRLVDAAGNPGASSPTRRFSLIGSVAGASIANVVTTNNATIPVGSVTPDNTPEIWGSVTAALPSGHVVRVLRNGAPVGLATVSGTSWTFTDSAPEGAVSYSARVEAGAVIGAAGTAWAFTVDSIAPTHVVLVTQISDDFIGVLAPGATTADQTPTVSGTLDMVLADGEALQVIRTNTSNGVAVLTNMNPSPSGTAWTYTEPILVPAGTYDYQARVFDRAGNVSVSSPARRVTIDPTAVPLPGAAATIASINGITPTGAPATIGNSNVNTPTLAGTIARALATGEVVRIFRNGTGVANATISVGSSNWTYTNGTLADGNYSFTAQVQLGSNSAVYGQMSASAAVAIDATIPTQTLAITGIFDSSSIAVGGNNTTTTTPRISGTLSAALGAGEVLDLLRTGGAGALTRQLTPTGGTNWTLTEPTALLTGTTYTYRLQVRDAAGNLSVSQPTQAVTILAALPSITNIEVAYSAGLVSPRANGTVVASGGSIADTTPTVQGTISAALSGGASVRVYRGATLVGSFGGAGTAWSVDDSDIGQGSRSYTARVENGTAYSATSGSYTVTVDTIAPAQTFGGITGSSTVMPNTTVSGATTPASGLISSGGSTNDNSPRLSFTLSAALASDEFLRVKRNGTTVSIVSQVSCGTNCFRLEVPATVTLTNNESGSLSLTAPATGGLPTAAQSYTVVVVDGAGNEGTASAAFSIAFNYFACDNVRANATYFAAFAVNHPSWTNLNCNSCHTTSTPGITPVAGTMIAVPSSTPTYWCRRP